MMKPPNLCRHGHNQEDRVDSMDELKRIYKTLGCSPIPVVLYQGSASLGFFHKIKTNRISVGPRTCFQKPDRFSRNINLRAQINIYLYRQI